MNKNLVNIVWGILALIAILMALYNMYLSWFEDNFSLYILYFTLMLIILSIIIQKYSEGKYNPVVS